MTRWQTLVSTADLATVLGREDLVVVDCRHSLADPAAGEAAYRSGHVPGARHAHLDRDLSGARAGAVPGAGRHPWPDAAAFAARLGEWGITPRHQVIAYDDGDGAIAARLWCLLRLLGHDRVAVLDGGWAAWSGEGRTIESSVARPAAAPPYPAGFDQARLLDAMAVEAHLAGGGLLVDARAGERFRGDVEPLDRIAGHVPGAINRPFADNLRGGRFRSREELAEAFGQLLEARPPRDLVAMCGSGVTACQHLLAMEHAGLPGARLFTGSWSGWIEDPDRPVAIGA